MPLLLFSCSVISDSFATPWTVAPPPAPGSFVHGISQARILEWVAISFSRGSSQPRDRTWVSHIEDIFFTIRATREALRLLPSYRNQNCMVLAQKQTHKSWNRTESPEIILRIYVNSSMTKGARTYNREKTVFSKGGAGKTGQ